MANGIPQYQDEQPILKAQPVASEASGYEAFAKTLGSIAGAAAETGITVMKEKSNAMYLSSVANIDQLKLSTQELILQDPSNAGKHVETMQKSIEDVLRISSVNNSDRLKLKTYASRTNDNIELDAVKAEVKQTQIATSFEHYRNWPYQLNALRDAALSQDPSKLESLNKSMTENIRSLVLTGAMTPLQGGAALESMNAQIDLAHDIHDIANSVNKQTAASYHTAMSSPFDPDKAKNIDYPVDENTRWMTNYHLQDRTFQGVQDGLQNHQLDIEAVEKLTPHQRQQIKSEINGIRMADGLIDSNTSLPKIKSRLEELTARTSYEAVAERKQLQSYVRDVENGNSQRLMARTSLGGQIVRDFTDKQSFLNNRLSMTNPENVGEVANIKADMAKNKNDYVNKSVAFAEAHHWPVVSPIPKEDVAVIENGFNAKGDPAVNAAQAYSTLSQYTKQNQLYVADQMKNPRQRVIVQTLAMGNQPEGEKIDFIAANQNRNYKELDLRTNEAGDNYLRNQVNANIAGAIKIIQYQNNPTNATVLNEQMIAAGVNYAKFLSEKKGKFTFEKDSVITFDSSGNIGDVKRFFDNAYEPMTGSNYVVNKKQVDLDEKEMSAVAQYAIIQGNKYLRANMSEAQFIQLQSQSPLTVTVTPTNVLVAKDAMGNIAFREPMTSDLVSHARSENKKFREEKVKEAIKQRNAVSRYFYSPELQMVHSAEGEENADTE